MVYVEPDYYGAFACKAGRCLHSCCIGWEIDIDEESAAFYRQVPGPFGQRLASEIHPGPPAHFRLGAEERCPFLNREGLCDIYIQLGEEALCQICAEHPRFYNEYSDRTEVGLGLCCEAAAALILGREAPMRLLIDGEEEPTPEEEAFFSCRDGLLSLLGEKGLPLEKRLGRILETVDAPFPVLPSGEWVEILSHLEILSPTWRARLAELAALPSGALPFWAEDAPPLSKRLENTLIRGGEYFLFRHLAGSLEEGNLAGRVGFAVLAVCVLRGLLLLKGEAASQEEWWEEGRLLSTEWEYSEENTQALYRLSGGGLL